MQVKIPRARVLTADEQRQAKMRRQPHRSWKVGGGVEGQPSAGCGAGRLPWLAALAFGSLWALLYFGLGALHAMWSMFDREFPFLFSSLLHIHDGRMSSVNGAFFAFADGAVAGGSLGWLFVRFVACHPRHR